MLVLPLVVVATTTPPTVARARVVDKDYAPMGSVTVQLWRNPEGEGNPVLVYQGTADALGRTTLGDPGLADFPHFSPTVGYSVTAYRALGSTLTDVGDFQFSVRVNGGIVEAQDVKDVTVKVQHVPGARPSLAQTLATLAPLDQGSQCPFVWQQIYPQPNWVGIRTVMGEYHATYSADNFFWYAVNAGNSIQTEQAVSLGAFSVSGSQTIYNSLSLEVDWPHITSSAQSVQTVSRFDYVEEGYYSTCQGTYSAYRTRPVQYKGSALLGSQVYWDDVCPSDVYNNVYGTNWADYIQGSGEKRQQTSGASYTTAATLTGAYNGQSYLDLTFGQTTYFEKNAGTNVYHVAGLPSDPVRIILFARSSTNWNTLYMTNTNVGCGGGGGGCVAYDTRILTPRGYVPVQDLKVGDKVMGYTMADSKLVTLRLVSVKSSTQADLISINGGTLLLTAVDQPIYVSGAGFTGFVRNPQDLKVGEVIFDAVHNEWVHITSIEPIHSPTQVFDVRTDGPNNFVANGFLLDSKQP